MFGKLKRILKKKDISNAINVFDKVLISYSFATPASSSYESRVEDITDKFVYISNPTRDGLILHARPNSRLCVSVVSEKGRVTFTSNVAKILTDNIRMLALETPITYKLTQLRAYYRVPVHMNASYSVRGNSHSYNALVCDISGGGCMCFAKEQLYVGDKLVIRLSDTPDLYRLEAKVVRCKNKHYGMQFINIKPRERDKLMHYISARQRDLLHLGVLS